MNSCCKEVFILGPRSNVCRHQFLRRGRLHQRRFVGNPGGDGERGGLFGGRKNLPNLFRHESERASDGPGNNSRGQDGPPSHVRNLLANASRYSYSESLCNHDSARYFLSLCSHLFEFMWCKRSFLLSICCNYKSWPIFRISVTVATWGGPLSVDP